MHSSARGLSGLQHESLTSTVHRATQSMAADVCAHRSICRDPRMLRDAAAAINHTPRCAVRSCARGDRPRQARPGGSARVRPGAEQLQGPLPGAGAARRAPSALPLFKSCTRSACVLPRRALGASTLVSACVAGSLHTGQFWFRAASIAVFHRGLVVHVSTCEHAQTELPSVNRHDCSAYFLNLAWADPLCIYLPCRTLW